jgi:hypothetical protein
MIRSQHEIGPGIKCIMEAIWAGLASRKGAHTLMTPASASLPGAWRCLSLLLSSCL